MCRGCAGGVLHTAATDTAAGVSMRPTAVMKLHIAGVDVGLLQIECSKWVAVRPLQGNV